VAPAGFPSSGRRAFEVGLANDVTPDDQLMAVAMARAEHIAAQTQFSS
jgi:enoyl-CoA hydratase/carnithine racemase